MPVSRSTPVTGAIAPDISVAANYRCRCRWGDHLLMSDISYVGAAEFTRGILRDKGIAVTLADMSDPADVAAKVQPNTKVIYAESPCNPVLKLVDIGAVAKIAHDVGAKLIIDSTFATPALSQPLSFGADYVATARKRI